MKKKLLAGLATGLFLAGMAGIAQAALVQWSSSVGGNDHWYDLVDSGTNGSWENAENNAVAQGGHLVTLNSALEETWLQSIFGDAIRYWIGFTDKNTEGTWVWASGETNTYTHWASGEPNNALPPLEGEDYAVMNWNSSGWNDWDHQRGDYYNIDGIVEYNRNPVPEPATMILFGIGLAGLVGSRLRKKKK